MSDDHERLLAVSERWRRLYEESQTELERLREAREILADHATDRWHEVERLRVENARLRETLRYPDNTIRACELCDEPFDGEGICWRHRAPQSDTEADK